MRNKAFLGDAEYYNTLGIKEEQVEVWEDGMRTHGGKGTFEWWYVDAELDNGITIIAVLFTKNIFDVAGPPCPTGTLRIIFPDGREITKQITEGPGARIKASKEKCDVTVCESYLKHENGGYKLKFVVDDIEFQVTMKSTLPMWRPGTGHWYFGDDGKYMAWFVAQPSADITGTLKIDGTTEKVKGRGYHDHNWGNISMHKVINHWYWGRAVIDGYTVIASDMISEKAYDHSRLVVFMVAKDGEILADDHSVTSIQRSGTHQHPGTGKFMDDQLTFIQPAGNETSYQIEFIREKDTTVMSLLDNISAPKRFLAKIFGANPTYVRVAGEVKLTVTAGGKETVHKNEGLWEQMFFSKGKEATIHQ